jgi:hypothetical protein
MANSINWGKIYCSTWFGDTAETTDAIPLYSAPTCWAGVLLLSADDTNIFADTTLYTADATQE